jgi:hypothetical protein
MNIFQKSKKKVRDTKSPTDDVAENIGDKFAGN